MKVSSPPRGSKEEEHRKRPENSFSARGAERTAIAPAYNSLRSSTYSAESSRHHGGAVGPSLAPRGRTDVSPRDRCSKKKKPKKDKEEKKKKRKKSRKKKHSRKERRVSTSSSSSCVSSPSHSRSSCSRSPSRLSSHRIIQPPPRPLEPPSASSSDLPECQPRCQPAQKKSGWDVGPDIGEGSLCADKRHLTSSFSAELTAGHREGRGGSREEVETQQQHDPRTYQKAFGVAVPSGQYSFVSEETDFTQLLPTAERRQVEESPAACAALPPHTSTIRSGAGASASAEEQSQAAPPSLGVFRLLKEASEAEKAKHGGPRDGHAEGLKRGGAKVTSKTHPHLFWQCWNCSADNYKTRHQCHRCNRLYMQ